MQTLESVADSRWEIRRMAYQVAILSTIWRLNSFNHLEFFYLKLWQSVFLNIQCMVTFLDLIGKCELLVARWVSANIAPCVHKIHLLAVYSSADEREVSKFAFWSLSSVFLLGFSINFRDHTILRCKNFREFMGITFVSEFK